MNLTPLDILDRFSDHLGSLLRLISFQNPNGMANGLLLGALFCGLWEVFIGPPNYWVCVPLGILIVNVRGFVKTIRGEPPYPESLLRAIQMIKDYEAKGGTKTDVRRLYFQLAQQLVREASLADELEPPSGTAAESGPDSPIAT